MSNKAKNTTPKPDGRPALTPKLRFPEFREATGWETTILGELSEVVRGGSPRPIDVFLTTAADGLNWLKIGDVDKEAKFVTQTAEKVRSEALSKTRVVNPGDLILSNSMSFGRPYILQIKTCIHDGWIAITSIAENTERDFLYYLISAPSSQSYFVDNAAGSGVQNLNADIIKALPVCFPPPPEQQKIAECLSSVDELIAAQARKLDALKTHKKGLMQQLFPREGETLPKLRFPEFRGAGEWVEMNLGEVTDFLSGGTPSKDRSEYWEGNIPWISALSMHDTCIDSSDQKITQLAVDEGARIAPKGTILLLVRGSMLHKRIPVGVAEIDMAFNQDVKALDLKINIHEVFLLYLLVSSEQRLLSAVTKTGIGAGKLDTNDLKDFLVRVPNKKKEQKKITDCLSYADKLITAQTHKLDTLKAHKKGLMQQLFPSPVEPTS